MKKALSTKYKVKARFQRSTRIDTDYNQNFGLDGYVLHTSGWNVLQRVATLAEDSTQRAFTWTGPYGSGKSSLALLLSALLGPNRAQKQIAETVLGTERLAQFQQVLPSSKKGWVVVHVLGTRSDPGQSIAQALLAATAARWGKKKTSQPGFFPASTKPRDLIECLVHTAKAAARSGDGLLLIMDEFGKFLEHSAQEAGDLHLFQELAESLGRAKAPCITVGILHQAFSEYASGLNHAARNEWAKIQGRYVDIPFSVGIDEIVDLVSRAIEGPEPSKKTLAKCRDVAKAIEMSAPRLRAVNSERLAACWPLHPLTALMLGPISRRRFGQNERSIFSILASQEASSFSEFLETELGDENSSYGPGRLWDYLQLNLEPAILSSPDGHKWAEAAECVQRAFVIGGEEHAKIAKIIALFDVFGHQVSLRPSLKLLQAAMASPNQRKRLDEILNDLQSKSVVIYRRHLDAWSVFAGSDIDIEAAVTKARRQVDSISADLHSHIPTIGPVVAKKEYHRTGTLRWFNIEVSFSDSVEAAAESADGLPEAERLVLVLPVAGRETKSVSTKCKRLSLATKSGEVPVAFGVSKGSQQITDLALELAAIEKVKTEYPALEGDAVARRELHGRINTVQGQITIALREALNSAEWFLWGKKIRTKGAMGISRLASEIAEQVFRDMPVVRNELVNREKPSSNAVSARRRLMYRMVDSTDKLNLAIEGNPPELGLYRSILLSAGLHRENENGAGFCFGAPSTRGLGASYGSLWGATDNLVESGSDHTISVFEIYKFWQRPPFGLKRGVLPILMLAYVLANEENLAIYIDNVFTPKTDDFLVDRLLQRPKEIRVRQFRIEGVRQSSLQALAEYVVGEFGQTDLTEPLEIAKPIVHFAHQLHPWVKRTKRLMEATTNVRDALLKASDPYALLFEDLPVACGVTTTLEESDESPAVRLFMEELQRATSELRAAYPNLLEQMQGNLLALLEHRDKSDFGFEKLKHRANGVVGLSGDFRLDAFARRLRGIEGGTNWIEGVCSLAANKPAKDWSDADIDKAKLEIADLCSRFKRIERYALTTAKNPGALSAAITIGTGKASSDYERSVILDPKERQSTKEAARRLHKELRLSIPSEHLQFASILQLLEILLAENEQNQTDPAKMPGGSFDPN